MYGRSCRYEKKESTRDGRIKRLIAEGTNRKIASLKKLYNL